MMTKGTIIVPIDNEFETPGMQIFCKTVKVSIKNTAALKILGRLNLVSATNIRGASELLIRFPIMMHFRQDRPRLTMHRLTEVKTIRRAQNIDYFGTICRNGTSR